MARLFCGVLLFLMLRSVPFAQSLDTTTRPDPPTRDPATVQLITSMDHACGWDGPLPATVVATGTVTFEGKTEALVIKAIPGALRVERPDSNLIVVVRDTAGVVITNGQARALTGGEAASIQPLMLPFYTELAGANDPTLAVNAGDTKAVAGQAVQTVNLVSTKARGDSGDSLRQASSKLSVTIATDKLLPLIIHFRRMAQENNQSGSDFDAYFSDFRKVDGMLVPFGYEERSGTLSLFTYQFQSVVFNAPIVDSDFSLN